MKIINKDGLLMKKDNATCLDYLTYVPSYGIVNFEHGKINISREQAKLHNSRLSQKQIRDLDDKCQIGESVRLYYNSNRGIITWIGDIVCSLNLVRITENELSFTRKGKTMVCQEYAENFPIDFVRVK